MDFLDRIAERIALPEAGEGAEITNKSKFVEIKNGEGKVTGHIEVFWAGKKLGWVTIPGASRWVEAGSELPQ